MGFRIFYKRRPPVIRAAKVSRLGLTPRRAGLPAKARCHVGQELGYVHRLQDQWQLPGLSQRQGLQIIDQPGQETRLIQRRLDVIGGRIVHPIQDAFQIALDDVQWCAKLVGYVRGQVAPPLVGQLQLLDHTVERRCQPSKLARPVCLHAHAQIPLGDTVCRSHAPKLLCMVPTLQNPLNSIMSDERRRAIVEVADRHGLPILEDGIYNFLDEHRATPVTAYTKTPGYYVTSMSKSISAALRTGLLIAAPDMRDPITRLMGASCLHGGIDLSDIVPCLGAFC